MEGILQKLQFDDKLSTIIYIVFVSSVATTLYIYWPGLSGSFVLDDTYTLRAMNHNGGITDFASLKHFVFNLSSSAIGRPVSMLSFLMNDQYYPGDPASFKYTNLMIHLLCGMFLVLFINALLRVYRGDQKQNSYIAVLVGTLWLLHPINVSTTLYIVQRMTQLVTLFGLISVYIYCLGRLKLREDSKKGIVLLTTALFPFGLLAVLSKENGVLILLYIMVIEYTLFQKEPRPKEQKRWIYLFIIIPSLIVLSFLIFYLDNFLGRYNARDFTLLERLLTESRILILYLYNIFIPQSGNTGLLQDDFVISRSLISPATTLFSIVLICSLLYVAFKYRRQQPVLSFGILWFFGGHILESTFMPLELYFEHRNYMPMAGPLLTLTYYINVLSNRVSNKALSDMLHAAPYFLIVVSAILTHQSATIWGHTPTMYKIWYNEHPNSLRAASLYAATLIDTDPVNATNIVYTTYKKHPYAIALPMLMLDTACRKNLTINLTIQDIIDATKSSKYTGALPIVAKRLFEAKVKYNCSFFNIEDLHMLFAALENNTQRIAKGALVEILNMRSDLYILQRQLSPAVETLDRAFSLRKLPEIPARQANILASAGLYQDALTYIEKAKMADSYRKPLVPSILPDLLILEKRYKELARL